MGEKTKKKKKNPHKMAPHSSPHGFDVINTLFKGWNLHCWLLHYVHEQINLRFLGFWAPDLHQLCWTGSILFSVFKGRSAKYAELYLKKKKILFPFRAWKTVFQPIRNVRDVKTFTNIHSLAFLSTSDAYFSWMSQQWHLKEAGWLYVISLGFRRKTHTQWKQQSQKCMCVVDRCQRFIKMDV